VRLTLWSRDRNDQPQAVVSHESALVLHDLSELLPGEIHLTVPPKFRKEPPAGCVLHKARLAPKDIEERAGFRVTVPLRTLLDVAASGVPEEQLQKAVADALSRGLVRRSKPLEAHVRTASCGFWTTAGQLPHDVARQVTRWPDNSDRQQRSRHRWRRTCESRPRSASSSQLRTPATKSSIAACRPDCLQSCAYNRHARTRATHCRFSALMNDESENRQ
jgi:hypothetical protein